MINLNDHLVSFDLTSENWVVSLQSDSAQTLQSFAANIAPTVIDTPVDPTDLGRRFSEDLNSKIVDPTNGFAYSGRIDRRSIMSAISIAKVHFSQKAILLIDNADAMSVYEAIHESILADCNLRFEELNIETDDTRPGRGLAVLTFDRSRADVQPSESIPTNKNRTKEYQFKDAVELVRESDATAVVESALSKWEAASEEEAIRLKKTMDSEHPDQSSPTGYWHENSEQDFVDFFTWGHDHDFGFGQKRQGAMSTRHIEIVSESIQYGFLDADLSGTRILNVGCWTGGDLLALAGMGAEMSAIEEHKGSAAAANRLCELGGCDVKITSDSLYTENKDWCQKFDVVYISGVIYHVTDPMLALRICFSYLADGGRIVVETKASSLEGSYCEYAGTLEKGWNWYAPTKDALGRWMVDAGFSSDSVNLLVRNNGRLLAVATKPGQKELPEKSGFSRPGSWLESLQ